MGHVGDSRCYLYADGVLEQLTSDHSVVGELLRSGTITPLEARTHPKRHILTQVLGSAEIRAGADHKKTSAGLIGYTLHRRPDRCC